MADVDPSPLRPAREWTRASRDEFDGRTLGPLASGRLLKREYDLVATTEREVEAPILVEVGHRKGAFVLDGPSRGARREVNGLEPLVTVCGRRRTALQPELNNLHVPGPMKHDLRARQVAVEVSDPRLQANVARRNRVERQGAQVDADPGPGRCDEPAISEVLVRSETGRLAKRRPASIPPPTDRIEVPILIEIEYALESSLVIELLESAGEDRRCALGRSKRLSTQGERSESKMTH